jgi:hypothetical protein
VGKILTPRKERHMEIVWQVLEDQLFMLEPHELASICEFVEFLVENPCSTVNLNAVSPAGAVFNWNPQKRMVAVVE